MKLPETGNINLQNYFEQTGKRGFEKEEEYLKWFDRKLQIEILNTLKSIEEKLTTE